MLIATNCISHPLLNKLAKNLNAKIIEFVVRKFSDGEISLFFDKLPANEEIILFFSFSSNVNEDLIKLLFAIDSLKEAKINLITLIIPYLCYSRQNRKFNEYGCVPAKIIAQFLSQDIIKNLIVLDLHNNNIKDFFLVPIHNLMPTVIFYKYLLENNEAFLDNNSVLVAPDLGAVERTEALANLLGFSSAIIQKNRSRANGEVSLFNISGNVSKKKCFIIDDIVDTADTIICVTDYLLSKGAISVEALCTHAVLSGDAIKKIEKSNILKVVVTDTISLSQNSSKIKILSVADLLSDFFIKNNLVNNSN